MHDKIINTGNNDGKDRTEQNSVQSRINCEQIKVCKCLLAFTVSSWSEIFLLPIQTLKCVIL